MNTSTLVIFIIVYVGMFLGRIPGLAIDRSGIALLGGIALLATGNLESADAWEAVDVPTIALLFGLMVLSAQLRLGGFYTAVTRQIAEKPTTPARLLAIVMLLAAGLSALLANDIICLAMTPPLAEGLLRRRLNPVPFLIGLACAANIGSAATLIGNPQNMLIGQALQLSFAGYLMDGMPPALLGTLAAWGLIALFYRRHWHTQTGHIPAEMEAPAFNGWQVAKGLTVLLALVVCFLAAPWPREVVALTAAGIILLSRRFHSRSTLGLVDWELLVLFIGLFVVNHALTAESWHRFLVDATADAGFDLSLPGMLFTATVVLSNLVSNVPAVMLLLPVSAHPLTGPILALASTLAGNLLLIGSIANLIVVEKARPFGIEISWREHALVGIPVTMVTLLIAAGWLLLLA
ncbi:MAG: SLC13 family permease [Geothermobacteraceae bacterium]